MTRLLHADAVLIGDGSTVRDGAVVLDGERVVDVGPAADVRARSTGARVERVKGVLLPGLVNAHTHLELSGLRGKLPQGAGFVPWLEALQKARVEELEEERDAAIDRAIASMVEAGVVAVGEVTNSLVAWPRLSRHFFGAVFHEVFAVDKLRGLEQVAKLEAARDAIDPKNGAMKWVPTPHALYSTHPDVVRALLWATQGGPLTIHLAEHAAERAFLRDGGGPLAAFYRARGLDPKSFPVPETDPVSAAKDLGLLRRDAALVHLADAKPGELDLVAEAGAIAVLCPRSNLQIETRYPPLSAMVKRGIRLALGTDSLASSPSLDPLAEAKALLERTPEIPASALISAATSGGARAVGWSGGKLEKGSAPGVLHVEGELPADVDPSAWTVKSGGARRLLARAAA